MRYCIIGCGLTGATVARLLAEAGKEVVIIEKSDIPGGHVADDKYHDTHVNRYGPHFFHTQNPQIVEFLSRFTVWKPFSVIFDAQPSPEMIVPWPINKKTVQMIYSAKFDVNAAQAWDAFVCDREKFRSASHEKETFETKAIAAVGPVLYDALIKQYSELQWRMSANDIPAEIFTRIRIKENDDPRFFSHDEFVAIPEDGYTAMIRKMIDHTRIRINYHIRVNEDDLCEFEKTNAKIINTAPVDELLGKKYGSLTYLRVAFRVIEGHTAEKACELWPSHNMNFNYAGASYTRGTAYHRIYDSSYPVVVFEEPGSGEALYPVRTKENKEIYERYARELAQRNILSLGRCGTYQYIDMYQAVQRAMDATALLLKE